MIVPFVTAPEKPRGQTALSNRTLSERLMRDSKVLAELIVAAVALPCLDRGLRLLVQLAQA